MAQKIVEHPDTSLLKSWARKQHEAGNTTLTFDAAAAVVRAEPEDLRFRARLRVAAASLLQACGAVYVSERNVGYRAALPHEAPELLASSRKRINRGNRRTVAKASTLVSNATLSENDQSRYFVEMAAAGAIGVASSAAARKQLEKRVSSSELPLAETIDVLRSL